MRKLQYPGLNVGYFAPSFDLIRLPDQWHFSKARRRDSLAGRPNRL
jgi:hypothetical protein